MIIAQAFAATEGAHHAGPFYMSPEFWVSVAFLLVVAAMIRPIGRVLKGFGASRAEKISKKIDEAKSLKDDAQKMLAEYERKFKNADEEAAAVIAKAKENADRLKKEAEDKMNLALAKKEEGALDRIKTVEQNATEEVRKFAVNTATDASVKIIAGVIAPKNGAKMLEESIKELPADLKKATA